MYIKYNMGQNNNRIAWHTKIGKKEINSNRNALYNSFLNLYIRTLPGLFPDQVNQVHFPEECASSRSVYKLPTNILTLALSSKTSDNYQCIGTKNAV